MNRVGEGGKGESVWLGGLLVRIIALFAPLAEGRDVDRARRWRTHAASVQEALEREAWDGEWYRRATFDDGTWLVSKEIEEIGRVPVRTPVTNVHLVCRLLHDNKKHTINCLAVISIVYTLA